MIRTAYIAVCDRCEARSQAVPRSWISKEAFQRRLERADWLIEKNGQTICADCAGE